MAWRSPDGVGRISFSWTKDVAEISYLGDCLSACTSDPFSLMLLSVIPESSERGVEHERTSSMFDYCLSTISGFDFASSCKCGSYSILHYR